MLPLTAKEVAEMAAGRLDGGDPDVVVTGVAIDSRAARPGDLFVALTGEHTDGHRFLGDAVERGASAVLVREDVELPSGTTAVRVDDTVAGLQRLAAGARTRMTAKLVAITGSSGKTITKELTAAVSRARFATVASAASFNNEIGVPLTILSAGADTEVVVAEVGSRGVGHIEALMPILRPDVSVVLNVGPAHIGLFGSLENVGIAKGELVEGLAPEGVAVLNADDAAVAAMASRTRGRTITFGTGAEADVRAEDVALDGDGTASFTLVSDGDRAKVSLRIAGEHLVSDALAAAAVGHVLGVATKDAATALSSTDGPAWRMQVVDAPEGWRVLNDAYNANPASTAAALKTLVTLGRGRRTWAVLGTMAELGEFSTAEHDRIGRLVVRLGVSRLIVIGEHARPLYEAARLEGMTLEEASLVPDTDQALAMLRASLAPDDVVLVKASRAAGLERVALAIAGEAVA
ncbi:MAG: UDP-N-acetylmuramoyl-tripeptide--D-alanyl-D-alanine ligase [Actinomycetota bacterium]